MVRHATELSFSDDGWISCTAILYGVTVEESRGIAQGKEYHGLVYSAIDDKGNKVGKPIKSSQFGKYAGAKAMARHFAKSKEEVAKYKLHFRCGNAISKVMRQTQNRDKLVAELKKVGIDTIFRVTDTGRIYGATFIDHNTGTVLNGSRMGKELSANAFEEHFSSAPHSTSTTYQQFGGGERQELSSLNQNTGGECDELGLFNSADVGDDPEEERFRRAMQRKKKKRKGSKCRTIKTKINEPRRWFEGIIQDNGSPTAVVFARYYEYILVLLWASLWVLLWWIRFYEF